MEETILSNRRNRWANLILVLILVLALAVRLYGLFWDGGLLFHPDERQLLLVVDALSFPWPPDWALLLSPQSPWNPQFFAYGSLPIYLLRVVASVAGRFNPDLASLTSSYIVGRVLSALFDVGTVYLIYRLGRRLYRPAVGLLAAFLVALTVLDIQLAHFFTVDSILAFFVVLVVLLALNTLRRPTLGHGALLGLGLGMALATKVSAAPLAITAVVAWFLGVATEKGSIVTGHSQGRSLLRALGQAVGGIAVTFLVALSSFLLFEPYALIHVVGFATDVITEAYMARGLRDVPYTRQYIGTLPYIYPAWQMIVWSMGLPLGVASFAAAFAALVHTGVTALRAHWRRVGELCVLLSWVLVYFGIVGSFHAKFLRYMLPIIPVLVLWSAWALVSLVLAQGRLRLLRRGVGGVALVVVVLGTSLYAVAYLHIYRQPHTWIQATAWICQHVPEGSTILVEHWDDPLPLRQAIGDLHCHQNYQVTTLPAYDPDNTGKLKVLLDAIQANEYIILSSNRLYDTISRLPGRYPLTSRYYQLLLGERLGFELVDYVAEYPEVFGVSLVDDTFSDPSLPQPRLLAEREKHRLAINLGRADESFTVYDHPKSLVFRKVRQLSRRELLELFGNAAQNLPAAVTSKP